jgi:transcriptional regulator with XRE-family HTH domain
MKDQLIRLMTHLGITATRFADEIGVQRSSISHILSGRNKPSYDFILKIIEKYPSLNPSWLLTGKGNMFTEYGKEDDRQEKDAFQAFEATDPDSANESDKGIKPENEHKSSVDIGKHIKIDTNVNNIETVILLFTDGTFIQYRKND